MAHKKRHHHEMGRRHSEMKAAGMISEDRSAPANMPQEVKYVAYPKYEVGVDAYLDDTIRGVDRQVSEDVSAARRAMSPTKY